MNDGHHIGQQPFWEKNFFFFPLGEWERLLTQFYQNLLEINNSQRCLFRAFKISCLSMSSPGKQLCS